MICLFFLTICITIEFAMGDPTTFRILGLCRPYVSWPSVHPHNENQTIWQGTFLSILLAITKLSGIDDSDIEMVTSFPERNLTKQVSMDFWSQWSGVGEIYTQD